MWFTQACRDIFTRAVTDARAELDNIRATNDEYEGESGGRRKSLALPPMTRHTGNLSVP
jgi:hypothetical protein